MQEKQNTIDEALIERGLNAISLIDEEVRVALQSQFNPPPRKYAHGFETFLSIIVSQQLSTKVAEVIMARVASLLKMVTPERVLQVSEQDLRDAGLSWRKVEYARSLANEVQSGRFNIDALTNLSNEDAIKEITRLKGFGRWSAEIYLMFALGRLDIFPADDLGVVVALGHLKGLEGKPTPKRARELVAHWSPWRSVGALFLWQYYHSVPK